MGLKMFPVHMPKPSALMTRENKRKRQGQQLEGGKEGGGQNGAMEREQEGAAEDSRHGDELLRLSRDVSSEKGESKNEGCV